MGSSHEPEAARLAPRPSSTLAGAALVALVSLAGACGGGGGGDAGSGSPTAPRTPGTPATPVASASVTMVSRPSDGYSSEEHRFAPDEVTLRLGGTVTWTNDSGVQHNVTFAAADGAPQDVGTLSTGSTTRTFAKAGTFGYRCTNHAGMSGSVAVQ
jgi:plastocyanin